VVGDAVEDIGQPGLRIDTIEFCCLNQIADQQHRVHAIDCGGMLMTVCPCIDDRIRKARRGSHTC